MFSTCRKSNSLPRPRRRRRVGLRVCLVAARRGLKAALAADSVIRFPGGSRGSATVGPVGPRFQPSHMRASDCASATAVITAPETSAAEITPAAANRFPRREPRRRTKRSITPFIRRCYRECHTAPVCTARLGQCTRMSPERLTARAPAARPTGSTRGPVAGGFVTPDCCGIRAGSLRVQALRRLSDAGLKQCPCKGGDRGLFQSSGVMAPLRRTPQGCATVTTTSSYSSGWSMVRSMGARLREQWLA